MACGTSRGVQLVFFTKWVCIENALEVVAEVLNYLASANADLGDPWVFFIACGVNLGMIVLELIEYCRTRRHGGKQTLWDRFWFGQVRQGSSEPRDKRTLRALTDPSCVWAAQWGDSTRKNFYAKYSARVMLGVHFAFNLVLFPMIEINNAKIAAKTAANEDSYADQVSAFMVSAIRHPHSHPTTQL